MMLIYIALGGALGSVARYGIAQLSIRFLGATFPYHTMFVNISGGLMMGLLIGLISKLAPPQAEWIRAFAVVGFLGGFTTFSAFSLDVVQLFERGDMLATALYITLSVTVSVLAVVAGAALSHTIPIGN